MIELQNVYKKYGDKIIFEDFTCNIKKGEFVGIMGSSGSGKSTLLNMMGLLEPCDSGEIFIDSKVVDFRNNKQVKELLSKKISFLFQNFALIDDFSVLGNLSIGLDKRIKHKREKIEDALDDLNLNIDINSKVFKLSGGEQQRVALARVILQNKDIVLADEPTASVDKLNREIILSCLKDLNDKGKTIVLVSHDDYVISRMDRIIYL